MEMTIGEQMFRLSYALIGLDMTEEFPVIWLRLRQAINRGAKVILSGIVLRKSPNTSTKPSYMLRARN